MTPEALRLTLRRERRWRLVSLFTTISLMAVILIAVENMLISCLFAFVLAYLMNPAVVALERTHIPRSVGILICFLLIGSALAAGISLLYPLLAGQGQSLIENTPKYVQGVTELLGKYETKLNKFASIYEFHFSQKSGDFLQQSFSSAIESLPKWVSKFFTVLLLTPLFAFFMLRDGRTLSRKILAIVPNNLFELGLSLVHQINEQMGAFIRARLLESAIVGAVVWIGLMILNFPYATFLAVFAALTNLIPYLGPVIGAIPAFVLAFINKDPSIIVFMVALTYFIAQLIDMVVIIPLVVAKIVDLHPITVIVVIIIGSQLMGILGMILAIPLASALKLIFSTVYNRLIIYRIY